MSDAPGETLMTNAWSIFEQALLQPTGASRTKMLLRSLRLVENDHELSAGERSELSAAIRCELARCKTAPFTEARDAVKEAGSLGRPGWPNYYLAEAAVSLGEYEIALDAVRRIPENFFEHRNLFWRTVRCRELQAIALIHIGKWEEAERDVERLGAAYASRGDSDDLAPPRDLVDALLDEGRDTLALAGLAASIDLDEWLDATRAARVRSALIE